LLGIRANNSVISASSRVPPLPSETTEQSVSALVRLNADEYMEAIVSQTSGGNLQVTGSARDHLAMVWVAPTS
jgi:hypothetical protein